MSVMTMLDAAQGGNLFTHVAESLDLDAAETRAAMARLCPAIAGQLKHKSEQDHDLFESLLELIEDGVEASPLEEPEALTDAEAVSDGNAILEDIYGSRNEAMVALRQVAGEVPERELSKLGPISATAVVAALAQANKPMALAAQPSGAQPASGSIGGEGIIGTIVGAVIAGAVSGLVRELTSAKRWRGTTGYTRTRSKRKTSSSSRSRTPGSPAQRRAGSPGVEDIFKDILGNLGK